MAGHETAARWTLRTIGGILVVLAILMLAPLLYGGAFEIALALVNAAIVGWVGVGLWRGREGAWIVAMMLAGATAAAQFVFMVGTRDAMLGFSFALNAITVALLIWAGRNLPTAPAASDATHPGRA